MKKISMAIILICIIVLCFDAYVLAGRIKRKKAIPNVYPEYCQDTYANYQITLKGSGTNYTDAIGQWSYVCQKINYGQVCTTYCCIMTVVDMHTNLVDRAGTTYYNPACDGNIKTISYDLDIVDLPPGMYWVFLDLYYGGFNNPLGHIGGTSLQFIQD